MFRTQLGKRADGLLEVLDLFLRSHPPPSRPRSDDNQDIELGAAIIAIRRVPAKPQQDPGTGRSHLKTHSARTKRGRNS